MHGSVRCARGAVAARRDAARRAPSGARVDDAHQCRRRRGSRRRWRRRASPASRPPVISMRSPTRRPTPTLVCATFDVGPDAQHVAEAVAQQHRALRQRQRAARCRSRTRRARTCRPARRRGAAGRRRRCRCASAGRRSARPCAPCPSIGAPLGGVDASPACRACTPRAGRPTATSARHSRRPLRIMRNSSWPAGSTAPTVALRAEITPSSGASTCGLREAQLLRLGRGALRLEARLRGALGGQVLVDLLRRSARRSPAARARAARWRRLRRASPRPRRRRRAICAQRRPASCRARRSRAPGRA